ncbi:hypothetical protein GL218_00139 [Daldinia childiae]|uniref:uncharacterized protein n=1 Tax=Daldinia childiae TaxID=326645 RepID=UPI0014458910|nr:uncharacterized protein GL218_00139 [Daldinia childiae]KAF3070563.1 hypothetical protein GL218_00139 [Daldinia childiae]
MFGVTPHAVPYIAPPAPPKTTNGRTKSRSSSLVPFRDDSKLVAFRYDQTVQAEPPIPIPPPRSSRRPPPRPISCNTARIPIVVPPPRPAPPTEQHPALRTISSPRTLVDVRKRDSCHSPTTPSSSWTIREDSETDDEDPFTYENVKKFGEIKPLQLTTRSASPSLYSRQEERNESAPKSPSGRLSPVPDPHDSPIISTTIPTESLLEDDFMTQLSFSKRGSLIFGAKHSRTKSNRNPPKMAEQHGIINNGTAAADRPIQPVQPRAFPLAPTREKVPDAAITVGASANEPAKFSGATDDALTSTPPTPRRLPPSVRVISAEAEKESQKVRSLYESGEGVKWEEGARHSSIDERIQPSAEDPSEENANDASNDQAGHPTPISVSTSSPQDNDVRREYELAGGIEDWEGVQVEDVDRYGFIAVQQPQDSRPSSPTGTTTNGITFVKSQERPQEEDVSTLFKHTGVGIVYGVASRLLDEAGDILATHPGLSHLTEDGSAERKLAESKLKETQRAEKWLKMATVIKVGEDGQGMVFDFDQKHPKLVKRVWKGIPDCWRAAAWYSFLSTAAKASSEPFATEEEIKADYHRLAEEPSPDDGQIDLDVPRTINQHIMFRRRYRGGQRLLFRVLHALSLYYPDTGYVQGMAPLAATFLSYFDEEMCFVMLVRLWKYRGLNRMYGSGFVALIEALKDFENDWLASRDVASKLTELCIDPTAYATKWYLTLFNLSIPFPVQLRVWDAFILLGSSPEPTDGSASPTKAVPEPSSKGLEILHATSLAIIDTLRPTLLDSDFENAMKSLTSWVPIKDEQGFMDLVQLEYRRHESKQKT